MRRLTLRRLTPLVAARKAALAAAIGASAIIGGAISLPVLPDDGADPVVAVNEDVGETIGWAEFTDQVAAVYRRAPGAVIFAANYGEAGAIDRYGPDRGLPGAYSGHNAYGDWGPPPPAKDGARIVAVGLDASRLEAHFSGCRQVARITQSTGVDNDENGAPILLCERVRSPWRQEWMRLRHLG